MNTYTIIIYVEPAGGHYVGTVDATDATDAVVRLREQLLLEAHECELVGVIAGRVRFELVDCTQVALVPYCAAIAD